MSRAIKFDNEKRVLFLIKKNKLNINSVLDNGYTPLNFAIKCGSISVAILLLNHGANPNNKGGEKGMNSLMYASCMYHDLVLNLVQVLIDKNVNINDISNDGRTALHYALDYNTDIIIPLLLESKINMDIIDNMGHIPLHMSIRNNKYEITTMLILHGADVNLTDTDGFNSLMLLNKYSTNVHINMQTHIEKNYELIHLILRHNYNTGYKTEDNESALDIMLEENNFPCAFVLIDNGFLPNDIPTSIQCCVDLKFENIRLTKKIKLMHRMRYK